MKKFITLSDLEVTPSDLAGYIVHQDSGYQASFFNEFFESLDKVCRHTKGSFGMGFQLLEILKELNVKAEATFALLCRELEEQSCT